ncbi:GNAT family N-acetyltransferase [Luteipulveratus mongoliensis]|nr:GNAT family N-acetyltransferase [Luteipulveratus mongoliensis]
MSPDRWDDLVALFGTRGDPAWCWCQFFVTTGQGYSTDRASNQESLRAQVAASERPLGLLAYGGGVPIGWLAVGPLTSYDRLTSSRSLAAVRGDSDDENVWRTTCFVVKVGHRRRGVATALLRAAVDLARSHGASAIEGHPIDVEARTGKVGGSELFHGALSTFVAAGFEEIGRTGPTRPVVRLPLDR